jgi:hypothetical protein
MSAVLLGGLAVLLALTVLDWYDYDGGLNTVPAATFRSLRDAADFPGLPWIVPAYFDWLAWALLIAVIAVGTLANFPVRASDPLRAIGLVLGAAGTAVTYWALQEFRSYGDEGSYAFQAASLGLWFAMGGFLLAGIGAAIGPRRI